MVKPRFVMLWVKTRLPLVLRTTRLTSQWKFYSQQKHPSAKSITVYYLPRFMFLTVGGRPGNPAHWAYKKYLYMNIAVITVYIIVRKMLSTLDN